MMKDRGLVLTDDVQFDTLKGSKGREGKKKQERMIISRVIDTDL
jgi:hypothetical protein